tara:strand:- start:3020 stop:3229 length:210 start_codon:yes stop_codon:yes gene_type:complete
MGDKNNGKNGYEIRESLLGMAIGILSDRDSRLRENEYLKPEGTRNPIKGYDVDEVLKTAERLYEFVSRK